MCSGCPDDLKSALFQMQHRPNFSTKEPLPEPRLGYQLIHLWWMGYARCQGGGVETWVLLFVKAAVVHEDPFKALPCTTSCHSDRLTAAQLHII